MKSPALNRILEKSPAASLAALSVGAFFRGDSNEHHRIFAALPSHGTSSRHEFFIQHHAMTEAVLLWTIELWKAYASTQTMGAIIVSPDSSPDEVMISEFMRRAQSANIQTLIAAMRSICDTNGTAFDDIAGFSGIDQMRLDDKARPIPKLIYEYTQTFGVTG